MQYLILLQAAMCPDWVDIKHTCNYTSHRLSRNLIVYFYHTRGCVIIPKIFVPLFFPHCLSEPIFFPKRQWYGNLWAYGVTSYPNLNSSAINDHIWKFLRCCLNPALLSCGWCGLVVNTHNKKVSGSYRCRVCMFSKSLSGFPTVQRLAC